MLDRIEVVESGGAFLFTRSVIELDKQHGEHPHHEPPRDSNGWRVQARLEGTSDRKQLRASRVRCVVRVWSGRRLERTSRKCISRGMQLPVLLRRNERGSSIEETYHFPIAPLLTHSHAAGIHSVENNGRRRRRDRTPAARATAVDGE